MITILTITAGRKDLLVANKDGVKLTSWVEEKPQVENHETGQASPLQEGFINIVAKCREAGTSLEGIS